MTDSLQSLNRTRASSLMEVLVSLLVFSIVLATTIKIIGMGRNLSLIDSQRQRTLDAADNLLTQINSGNLFWQSLFTIAEKQTIREKLHAEYGSVLPEQIENFAFLESIFKQNPMQKISAIKLDYVQAPLLYIERRTIQAAPWLIHIVVSVDDDKKRNNILLETFFSESLMRPVSLKSL